jgi:hypothetical protein
LIGLVSGWLTAATVGGIGLLGFLNNSASAYSRFPSLPRPWLAIGLFSPLWLNALLSVCGALAFTGMGLATVLLLRPKTRWEDGVAGVATGLVGGVTALLTTLGWATILAQAVLPSFQPLGLLIDRYEARAVVPPGGADATDKPKPSHDALLDAYPDLKNIPEGERLAALCNKILADLIVGIPRGIWLGTLFTLISFVSFGVYGTMAAGDLLRHFGGTRRAVLPYLQATVPGCLLILALYQNLFFFGERWPGSTHSGWLVVLLLAAMTLMAAAGVIQRWPGPLWLALYAAGLIAFLRLTWQDLPWYADVVVYTLGIATVARHHARQAEGSRV